MMRRTLLLFLVGIALAVGGPGPRFLPARDCALCHTRIPEPGRGWTGAPWVGPNALWPATMMAHASRDPYWKAKVESEVALAPGSRQEIEDTCLRCHAPSQQYIERVAGRRLAVAQLADQGREGVTCTVCHQILGDALGTQASFTGSFQININDLIFGPHAAPFTMPMLHHTGYTPREGQHILQSALCASCHTVVTRPPGDGGDVDFVEQAPFLEWLASSYPAAGKSCQSCHMPMLRSDGGDAAPQYIAHRPPGGPFPPTRPRTPFGRHEFAGGNTLLPALMARENTAQAEQLLASAERARRQLASSLRLHVTTRRESQNLLVDVEVINLAGHKLPTGFPSRRLWLRVELAQPGQGTLFESGGWTPGNGELKAGEGLQPHHQVIQKPSEVQVFETEAVDRAGRITVSLLPSATHLKDNRILPNGFEEARLSEHGITGLSITPAGVKVNSSFRPGSSLTTYRIPLPSGAAACELTVEALYQSIKPSHRLPAMPIPAQHSHPEVIAQVKRTL